MRPEGRAGLFREDLCLAKGAGYPASAPAKDTTRGAPMGSRFKIRIELVAPRAPPRPSFPNSGRKDREDDDAWLFSAQAAALRDVPLARRRARGRRGSDPA